MKPTHNPTNTGVTEVTPAVILRGAAAYLQLHGWTQFAFFDGIADTPFPPVCALGAIRMAALGDIDAVDLVDVVTDPNTPLMATQRLLAGHIDPDFDPCQFSSIQVVGDWNDENGRTADEVIQALQEAADDWDRLHPAGGAR